jgi:hypothetical protein
MDNHGPHDMMNLWEGNDGEQFGADGYFGGSSHGTLHRSYITGRHPRNGAEGESVRLLRLSYYYNIIGNVLGTNSNTYDRYVQQTDGCPGLGPYALGFPNIGNCSMTQDSDHPTVPISYPDAKVTSTLCRWGNYDYFNDAIQWTTSEMTSCGTPAAQTVPTSYVYTSRPSFIPSSIPWPPIGPDVTGGNGDTSGHVNKIPARLCWETRNLVAGGTFNRAACYP